MKILDNIGLGLFLFSIVSTVFWSPSSYSISHGLDDAINKISKTEQFLVEKAKTIPSKTNLAIKDTIGRMKIDIEDSKDLYGNSLTQTNEDNVNPTLNEVSNWISVDQDPSIIQEHLNNPKEKSCEVEVPRKETRKINLDASYITSNDLKDTTYSQNIELYKQTTKPYDQSNLAFEVTDKSSIVIDVAKNEVSRIRDTTFQEMHMKKPSKFSNNSVSNIVGSLEENVYQKDLNESNTLYNSLQLLGKNNIEDDVENTTNIVYKNMQLLAVHNSNDFITKNAHINSQELGEQWDQMSKDTRLNPIEQSCTKVNSLQSMFKKDAKINEVKNEINSPKELSNYWNDQKNIYDQNENSYENIKKHDVEVSSQQYKHFQHDYDDDTNYEGVKDIIIKNSHRTYEGAKDSANVDYKGDKYIQHVQNHAHHHYRDGRHKSNEVYKPMKVAINNFGKNNQYNDYDGDDYDDNDDDFYDDDDEDF